MNNIYIYTERRTERLLYTLDVVFNHVLFLKYKLLSEDEFRNITDGVKINYSSKQIKDSIHIRPYSLLFSTKITDQNIKIDWKHNIPYFFKTSENKKINHDLFSSVFYMVSRYEEYLPSELDIHNRFKAENTIAFKNNFLEKPVVNLWIKELQKLIEINYPLFEFPKKKYTYLNTIDIDIAYSDKGKSKINIILNSLKCLCIFEFTELKNKYFYFRGYKKDAFDTYDLIEKLTLTQKIKTLYFIQIGKRGKYDKNLPHTSFIFKELIHRLGNKNTIGIHPSYNSNNDKNILYKELRYIEKVLDKKTTKSRQHFLKLSFPETYENLIEIGIEEDYTLGFPSKIGFRAGICNAYPFFNLSTNKTTTLKLYPFQIMDGTLNNYMKLTPELATKKIDEIIASVKSVDGTFISIWHNSSLSELYGWKNWLKVYSYLLQKAKES